MTRTDLSSGRLSYKTKLKYVVPPVILVLGNIFLFGPATIYSGNISEFNLGLLDLLRYYALPSILIFVILAAIGVFLKKKYLSSYASLLFTLGILLWFQGNIFIWKYGLLDGQGIDWTRNTWRGWVDGGLWLGLLIMAWFFRDRIQQVVISASLALILLQGGHLGVVTFKNPEMWRRSNGEENPLHHIPREICEFSSHGNVIHFILDGFQSDIFEDIINEDIEYYSSALDGFTFFRETTGSFPTTYMSIPAILSGVTYTNDMTMPEFVKKTLEEKTISNVLFDNGYEVDLVHIGPRYFAGRFSNTYRIRVPYRTKRNEYVRAKAAVMMDLVLFRYAPHFAKELIYNNQSWFLQRFITEDNPMRFHNISRKAFLDDIISTMSTREKKNTYKFFHITTTHAPVVINHECEFAGAVLPFTRDNLKNQCTCGLGQFLVFLEKLRSLGVYDESLIILQADHGAGKAVEKVDFSKGEAEYYLSSNTLGSALPLMVIKPPFSKGALQISNVQAALTDTAATICSILNIEEEFPGESVFEMSASTQRRRKYYDYAWKDTHWQADFLERLDEYIIEGSVFDPNSWRLGSVYRSKEISYRTTGIDFGTDEASRFLLAGWGGNGRSGEVTHNWGLGRRAAILVSLPKDALQMTAKVRPLVFEEPQTITITVDGETAGVWNLQNRWEWQEVSIIIGPDAHRPDVSVVQFAFSQYRPPGEKETRPLAVLFDEITFDHLSGSKETTGS